MGEKDAYREDFSVVQTISIMDSVLPVRNICCIYCSEVDHKNACTQNPDNFQNFNFKPSRSHSIMGGILNKEQRQEFSKSY